MPQDTLKQAPTNEVGYLVPPSNLPGIMLADLLLDEFEHIRELRGAEGVRTLDKMRKDPHIAGLFRGMTGPITRYRWMIDPAGARPEVYKPLAEDLGLPIRGEEIDPRRQAFSRFNWDYFLRHALLSLAFGHMFFEQVGEIRDGMFRYRKLAPRMPLTITDIELEADGGLKSIIQGNAGIDPNSVPRIGVERLVAFAWEQEGAQWRGSSILRPCHEPWVLTRLLVKLDTMQHERFAVPSPVFAAPPNAGGKAITALGQMATELRSGDRAGGAVPHGTQALSTPNSPSDVRASIAMNRQVMSRSMMMQHVDLGTTESGSRALAETFVNEFNGFQESVAEFICGVSNPHILGDWVRWNFGEDELPPLLVFEKPADERLSVADMGAAIDKGLLPVDEQLRDAFRHRFSLPRRTPSLVVDRAIPVAAAAGDDDDPESDPKPRRRELTEQELAAGTDFEQLDRDWSTALDELVKSWAAVTAAHIAELAEQVRLASTLSALAAIQVAERGAELLVEAAQRLVELGARSARAEAEAQGVQLPATDLEAALAAVQARGVVLAGTLARSISEAASRFAQERGGEALDVDSFDADAIAADLVEHLESLSDAFLRTQIGGLLTQSQNAGRFAVMQQAEDRVAYFAASELLDTNTCDPCEAVDDTRYESFAAALADYPTGIYPRCKGGKRCRGTLVAVYGESPASVKAAARKIPQPQAENSGQYVPTPPLIGDEATDHVKSRQRPLIGPQGPSLTWYTEDGYEWINSSARGQDIGLTEEQVEQSLTAGIHIEEAIARQRPLKKRIRLWRGVTKDFAEVIRRGGIGYEFDDLAFTSNSTKETAPRQQYGKGGLVMRMDVPKGMRALHVQTHVPGDGKLGREAEVLMGTGHRYRVVDVDSDGVHVLELLR